MTFCRRKTHVKEKLTTHSIRVSFNIQANEEFNSTEKNFDEKCPQKKQAIEGWRPEITVLSLFSVEGIIARPVGLEGPICL